MTKTHMKLTSLRLQDFRNYVDQSFDFTADRIIFCGPNGAGKTNVLEAISLLSVGKSWREHHVTDLITQGQAEAQITTTTDQSDQYTLQLNTRARRFLKNEKPTTRTKLLGQIPTLLFCPEYLQLLTGPKSPRTAFFDRFLVQTHPHYRAALQKALKAHRQKTSLLRLIRSENKPASEATALLHPWNQILAETMPVITDIRQKTLAELAPDLQQAVNQLAGNSELFTIELLPAEPVPMETQTILDWFGVYQDREIAAAKNFIAPQRDDFGFFLREQPLGATASRGETRTVLLALLEAQKHYLKAKTGQAPILLLDDVFSELDDDRQAQLEHLCQDSQVFFTTTHAEHFDRFKGQAQVFVMKQN